MEATRTRRGPDLSPNLAQQVRTRVRELLVSHNKRLEPRLRAPKKTLDLRVNLVVRTFREMWGQGYAVQRPENLRQAHCLAALQVWRERRLTRGTAAQKWKALEVFSEAVGKGGMLPEFGSVWPKCQDDERERGRRRTTCRDLTARDYERLLERLDPRTPSYWVVRLEREMGLTREEALMSNLVLSGVRTDTGLVVSRSGGQQTRVVPISTAAHRALTAGATEFVSRRGRERLCWRGMSDVAAIKRVSNAVGYQIALMRDSCEGLSSE